MEKAYYIAINLPVLQKKERSSSPLDIITSSGNIIAPWKRNHVSFPFFLGRGREKNLYFPIKTNSM